MRRSAEKICWEDLLRRSAVRRSAVRRSAEKICWEDLLRKSAEKICWEDLLRKSAEKICWIKTSLKFISFFYAGWVWSIKTGDHPLVTSCSSDVRNCGEMRIFEIAAQPSRHFVVVGRPKLRWNANFEARRRNPLVTSWSSDVQNWGEMRSLHVVVATLSSLRARRTSKTEVKCESAWVLSQPSRRFVLIGRPKLWWNANVAVAGATLSSLRAGQMSETVVKCWFLYAAGCLGRRALDSYILAHAAVVKRAFWNFEWHAVVARRTFCFCWMNPLVGFGGSIARNCGEMQIFCGNCRKHRARRSFWKYCSMKFGGSLARKASFGSLFC